MEVSEESDSHIDDSETVDALPGSCRDAPHDAWPEVHKVRRADDDELCRAGTFRIWTGVPVPSNTI